MCYENQKIKTPQSSSIRILMLNYEFPPIGGGTGNACYYMLREFARYSDLHIDLVTWSPDNRTRIESFANNVQIHYVACGPKNQLHAWKSSELLRWLIHTSLYLCTHLKTRQYHLIHCWSGWPAGMLGYIFRKKAPYLIALRGSDVPGHTPRTALLDALVLRRISRRIWRNAISVTVVSRYLKNLASQTFSGPFHVINNGIDTTEFFPTDDISPSHPVRLLYVGRINPHKGVDDLIAAMVLLKPHLPVPLSANIHLTIVGSGSLADEVTAEIQRHQLQDAVTMLGVVSHDRLPSIYRQNDIFVFPCHSDAMANVILEATASGLAIIATNTGGAEIIQGNGLLINSGDPTNIKDKILDLVSQPQKLQQMKLQSTRLANKLGWDHCCDAYYQLYKSGLKIPVKNL